MHTIGARTLGGVLLVLALTGLASGADKRSAEQSSNPRPSTEGSWRAGAEEPPQGCQLGAFHEVDACTTAGALGIVTSSSVEESITTATLDEAIIAAASENSSVLVRSLVARGASARAREGAPLTVAASEGHLDMVILLISLGATPQDNCSMALVAAAKHGRTEVVRLLIATPGVNVRARDYGALVEASSGGHAEVVALLLDAGCSDNVSILSRAMGLAMLNRHAHMGPLFTGLGASFAQLHKDDPDNSVFFHGPLDVVQLVMEEGLVPPYQHSMILSGAAEEGHLDVIAFLFENCNLEHLDVAEGISSAITGGREGVAMAILGEPNVELLQSEINEILCEAIVASFKALASLLMARGGFIDDAGAEKLLAMAVLSGSLEQVELATHLLPIEALGAQLHLYPAMASGKIEMVRLMLAHGAVLNERDVHKYLESTPPHRKAAILELCMEHFSLDSVDCTRCAIDAACTNAADVLAILHSRGVVSPELASRCIVEAASLDHIKVMRYLASIGADLTAYDCMAFRHALLSTSGEAVRFLLAYEEGAYAHLFLPILEAGCLDFEGNAKVLTSRARMSYACDFGLDPHRIFSQAAIAAFENTLEQMLPYILPVDRPHTLGVALIGAVLHLAPGGTIHFLVQNGADLALGDNEAAFVAASTGYLVCLKYLLSHGASIRKRANAAFIEAASSGIFETLDFLLLHGASIRECEQQALAGMPAEYREHFTRFLSHH